MKAFFLTFFVAVHSQIKKKLPLLSIVLECRVSKQKKTRILALIRILVQK